MDPEVRRHLEEIHALTKDNHRILKAMRRDFWIGVFMKLAFWAAVILLPIYFYQQYVGPLVEQYRENPGSAQTLFGFPSSAEIQKLIDSYKAGFQ